MNKQITFNERITSKDIRGVGHRYNCNDGGRLECTNSTFSSGKCWRVDRIDGYRLEFLWQIRTNYKQSSQRLYMVDGRDCWYYSAACVLGWRNRDISRRSNARYIV